MLSVPSQIFPPGVTVYSISFVTVSHLLISCSCFSHCFGNHLSKDRDPGFLIGDCLAILVYVKSWKCEEISSVWTNPWPWVGGCWVEVNGYGEKIHSKQKEYLERGQCFRMFLKQTCMEWIILRLLLHGSSSHIGHRKWQHYPVQTWTFGSIFPAFLFYPFIPFFFTGIMFQYKLLAWNLSFKGFLWIFAQIPFSVKAYFDLFI